MPFFVLGRFNFSVNFLAFKILFYLNLRDDITGKIRGAYIFSEDQKNAFLKCSFSLKCVQCSLYMRKQTQRSYLLKFSQLVCNRARSLLLLVQCVFFPLYQCISQDFCYECKKCILNQHKSKVVYWFTNPYSRKRKGGAELSDSKIQEFAHCNSSLLPLDSPFLLLPFFPAAFLPCLLASFSSTAVGI